MAGGNYSNFMRLFIVLFSIAFAAACSSGANGSKPNVSSSPTPSAKAVALPVYGYEIVNTYPHDSRAFTQGLVFYNGFLYESTGQEGDSTLRKVELATGKVLQKFDLPDEDFGEGVTLLNDKLYMLTWRNGLGRVFDVNDFKLLKEFSYLGEGWGITNDGTSLYLSQGTHVLKVIDPETFKLVRTIPIMREDGKPLMNLNELEWIKGEIWANIWHSEQSGILGKRNYVARIDPAVGKVVGWVNLAGISPKDQGGRNQDENSLNGIAYDAAADRYFVTGKNWKNLYEIKITEPPTQ